MKKRTDARKRLRRLFRHWRQEDKALIETADQLLEEFQEAELAAAAATEQDSPRQDLTDTCDRLRKLFEGIQEHFAKEDEIGELLIEARGGSSIELDSTRFHAERDHLHLLARLRELVEQLSTVEPSTESRSKAIADFSLFIDAFDQHEEEEEGNLAALMPRQEVTTKPAVSE